MISNMKTFLYALLLGTLALSGCKKWLDVKPEDKFLEEQLYASPQGFADALNGLYIRHASSDMYGGKLTMLTMDILAQLYLVPRDHPSYAMYSYQYGDASSLTTIDSIWTGLYVSIANTNKFLQSLDQYGKVLDSKTKAQYKGEALGLRAFYYSDLMRMFTKAYTTPDSLTKVLPYYKEVSNNVSEFRPSTYVMQQILQDLDSAQQLLLENDPAVGQDRVSCKTIDAYRGTRNYSMNYYAVRALKARVNLWKGDNVTALQEALFLISQQNKFPWIQSTDLSTPATCNKIFSTEVIFAAENPKQNDLFNNNFNPTLSDVNLLAPNTSGTFITKTIFESNMSDYRAQYSWKIAGRPYYTFFKFQDVSSDGLAANKTVPLIRMGEMYLIAAECQPDLSLALSYINSIRIHRNLTALPGPITAGQLSTTIMKEYRREFYGEGQLFFYYKRTKAFSVIGAATNAAVTMSDAKYTFPVPLSETTPR